MYALISLRKFNHDSAFFLPPVLPPGDAQATHWHGVVVSNTSVEVGRRVQLQYRFPGQPILNFRIWAEVHIRMVVDCFCLPTGECRGYIKFATWRWRRFYTGLLGGVGLPNIGDQGVVPLPPNPQRPMDMNQVVNPVGVGAFAFAGYNVPVGPAPGLVATAIAAVGQGNGPAIQVRTIDIAGGNDIFGRPLGFFPVIFAGIYQWQCIRTDLTQN